MIKYEIINQIKDYASSNNIPIMCDSGIKFLTDYIKQNKIKNILEIGTAIGYSAIMMASVSDDINVITIERDEKRYLEAVKNIKKMKLDDRIQLIYKDALEVKLYDKFDLIFIDAAKAQNIKFFERFEYNLNNGGTILTDNMNFHGLVFKSEKEIESRNLRQLVRKIKNYKTFLENNKKYITDFVEVGDGIAVSKKVI